MKTKNENPQGLLAKLKNQGDAREPGWKTLEELLREDPMPETTARGMINDAIAAGIVEVKKMKSPTKNGLVMRLNYREKP